MPSIIAICRKCRHAVLVEGADPLPSVCANEDCDCSWFVYRRIVTPDYILTSYDRAFLIRDCGIRPE